MKLNQGVVFLLVCLFMAVAFAGCVDEIDITELEPNGQVDGAEVWQVFITEPSELLGYDEIVFQSGENYEMFEYQVIGKNLRYPARYSVDVTLTGDATFVRIGYAIQSSLNTYEFRIDKTDNYIIDGFCTVNRNGKESDELAGISVDITYTSGTTDISMQKIGDAKLNTSIAVKNEALRAFDRADVPTNNSLVQFATGSLYSGIIKVFFKDNDTFYTGGAFDNGYYTTQLPTDERYRVQYTLTFAGATSYNNITIEVTGDSNYYLTWIAPEDPGSGFIYRDELVPFALGITLITIVAFVLIMKSRKKDEFDLDKGGVLK